MSDRSPEVKPHRLRLSSLPSGSKQSLRPRIPSREFVSSGFLDSDRLPVMKRSEFDKSTVGVRLEVVAAEAALVLDSHSPPVESWRPRMPGGANGQEIGKRLLSVVQGDNLSLMFDVVLPMAAPRDRMNHSLITAAAGIMMQAMPAATRTPNVR